MNIHDMKQLGLILVALSVIALVGGSAAGFGITFDAKKPEGIVTYFLMGIGGSGMLLIFIDLAFQGNG